MRVKFETLFVMLKGNNSVKCKLVFHKPCSCGFQANVGKKDVGDAMCSGILQRHILRLYAPENIVAYFTEC